MALQSKGTSSYRLHALTGVAVLAAVAAVAMAGHAHTGTRVHADTAAGLAYLTTLEQQDPQAVKDILNEQREQRRRAESAERREQLERGDVDVWSLFGDAAICGDSRAVGFSVYEFMPQARVLAEAGDTIRKISAHTDELRALNPHTVFFCYGINDVSIGFWPTPEDYAAEYETILQQVQAALPDAKLYVNAIIPAAQEALSREERWGSIPAYNDALQQMCQDKGYGWVDIRDLVAAHEDLYDEDAIHMQIAFYPLWAEQMMMAVYDDAAKAYDEHGDGDSAAAGGAAPAEGGGHGADES